MLFFTYTDFKLPWYTTFFQMEFFPLEVEPFCLVGEKKNSKLQKKDHSSVPEEVYQLCKFFCKYYVSSVLHIRELNFHA